MRVRTLTLRAGPDGIVQPGSVLEVSEAEAHALVARGYAELIGPEPREAPPIETAQAPPAPERAVTERGRRRRGL